MRKITVIAAGLGWKALEKSGSSEIAGLKFGPRPSCFPAVTCVAQADLRTGKTFADHGMISNGWWCESLRKPLFWEQSARLVKGGRIWDGLRASGLKIGMFFFQQSLGESVDVVISPAPIHKHGGGMVMSCYTKPSGMDPVLKKLAGRFPLWRYWGPLSSPEVGRKCISYFEQMTSVHDVDEAYLYLPTLDYTAQKYGPDSLRHAIAIKEFRRQLERLSDIAMRRGAELAVMGDYEISPVTAEPVCPNLVLRKAGLFKTRTVADMAYPDFYESGAFAMCDHEFCLVYGEKAQEAVSALLATGDYEYDGILGDSPVAGNARLLLARQGSWCEYKWWTDDREAPDFASHVDIHNKPGFDPRELFFFNRGTVMGTHGRRCEVASTL